MVDIINKLENPSPHKDSIFADAQSDNKRIWPLYKQKQKLSKHKQK
jgi:hypothetical protein